MNTVWILVCDSARARFFEIRAGDPSWHLVSEISHGESKSKADVLVSDQSGTRSSEGGSVHHNALAPASSPKEVEKAHFAHALRKTLDQAMRSARFRRWVLVAPPHFVGLMGRELSPELKKHLAATVDKDLNHVGVHELAERLKESVRIAVAPQDSSQDAHKRAH